MITFIVMVLAALAGVWLLSRTRCISTRFITPPVPLAARVHLRKTRRGWTSWLSLGLNQRRHDVAWNESVQGAGELQDTEKDAMLRELLDLDHDADDDEVRERFADYGTDDSAENAKRAENRKVACNALGLKEDATAEEFHAAILAVPKWLEDLRKEASNAKKSESKVLLDVAINDGRITQAQRSVYETAFNSDFDGTRKKLAGEDKKLNMTRLNMQGRKNQTSELEETSAQVQTAVNDLMQQKKLTYPQAWNAVKKDKRFTSYFDLQQKQPEVAVA